MLVSLEPNIIRVAIFLKKLVQRRGHRLLGRVLLLGYILSREERAYNKSRIPSSMINMEQKLEEAMDMVHPQTIRFGKLRGNYEYRVNTKNHLAGSAWYCCPWQRRELVKREIVWNLESSAFAIQEITANCVNASSLSKVVKESWKKPPVNTYKDNVDAPYLANLLPMLPGAVDGATWRCCGYYLAA